MITYRNKLDVTPGGVPLVIHLSQYDDDFTLEFEPYSVKGTFNIETDTTVMVRGTKSDGHGYSAQATISGGVITITGDNQMTAVSGIQIFEVVFVKNNKELSTANFILNVERAAMDMDTIVSASKIHEVAEVIGNADEIVSQVNAAKEYIETYIEGVIYGDEVGY